jgi:hypothetical protein
MRQRRAPPVFATAQQLPTVTEALRLMSAWRTKRYLLAIVGDEITPNELGYRASPALNLHLKGTTIRVGGDVDAPAFAGLGEATKLGGWDADATIRTVDETLEMRLLALVAR